MTASRRLRILQIMRAPVGGLFRHVADLAEELAGRGHALGLVVDSLVGDAQTEEKLTAVSSSFELGIHRHAMPRLLGPGDLALPLRLRRLGQDLGIEIYHGHGAKGGFHARIAAPRKTGIGTFYTPHGGVLHFDANAVSGRLFHRLERLLMARTSAIFFESDYARRTYGALIGEPSCPVDVVHNGLRPDEFLPVQPDPDAADFVFIGELRTLKGVEVLLDALVDVRGAGGGPATLHLVGDGPQRAEFEQQARRNGLSERVTFAGAGPARAAFRRGRCVVVPSLAESLPYIVMEAAAAELPVIATRVGGIPEIFGPTSDRLVPAGDADALRAAMQGVIDDPAAARADVVTRLERVRSTFSVARMADAIETRYLREIATG